jgi:NHL repeat
MVPWVPSRFRQVGRVPFLGLVAVSLAALLIVPGGVLAAGPGAAGAPALAAPNPFATGSSASVAIGQTSLTTVRCGTTASSLSDPVEATFDSAGDLWVADRGNNRVLEFTPPLLTGMSASLVLGQNSFTTNGAATTQTGLVNPSGLAFDAHGDLWVADRENNRVLEFVPPFSNGMDASLVLGQTSFTSATAGLSASGMNNPEDVAFAPNGDLVVADAANNRVLVFDPPFTTGMNASLVLGQSNFTVGSPGTSATSFNFSSGVAFGPSGALFVADGENSRALEFLPPFSDGMAASIVFGQANFTTSGTGTSATTVDVPYGLWVDASGDLWLVDQGNNRTLEFVPPFSSGMAASVVLGQAGFSSRAAGTAANQVDQVRGATTDGSGDLWAADESNCRILEYAPPHFTVTFVESGLPAGTLWAVTMNGASAASTSSNLTITSQNGSLPFRVSGISGYAVTPRTGTVSLNGTYSTVYVTFAPTIAGLSPAAFGLLVGAVVIVVASGAAALVVRRRTGRERPGIRAAPPFAGPPAAPPPGGA